MEQSENTYRAERSTAFHVSCLWSDGIISVDVEWLCSNYDLWWEVRNWGSEMWFARCFCSSPEILRRQLCFVLVSRLVLRQMVRTYLHRRESEPAVPLKYQMPYWPKREDCNRIEFVVECHRRGMLALAENLSSLLAGIMLLFVVFDEQNNLQLPNVSILLFSVTLSIVYRCNSLCVAALAVEFFCHGSLCIPAPAGRLYFGRFLNWLVSTKLNVR